MTGNDDNNIEDEDLYEDPCGGTYNNVPNFWSGTSVSSFDEAIQEMSNRGHCQDSNDEGRV